MADTTEKKTYLINVEDNLDAYAQRAADAGDEVARLTAENIKLKGSTTATAAEVEKNNAALRNAQKEYANAKKNVELATKANVANKNSYEELYRRWQLAQTQLKLMGDGYTTNAKGVRVLSDRYQEQSRIVADAKRSLDAFGKGVNDNRLNVGNYGEAVQQAFKGAGASVMSMVSPMALITAGTAAAMAIFNGLKEALLSTGAAMDKLNIYGQITKQMFYDLATSGKISTEAMYAAAAAAELMNEKRKGDRKDMIEFAALEREIAMLEFDAADKTKTRAEREEALTQAIAKQNELSDKKVADAREDLRITQELIAIRPKDEKLRDQLAQQIVTVINLDKERFEQSKRNQAKLTGFLKEEVEERNKLTAAWFKEIEEQNKQAEDAAKKAAEVRKKAAADVEKEIKKNHEDQIKWAQDKWKGLVAAEKQGNDFQTELLKILGIEQKTLGLQVNKQIMDDNIAGAKAMSDEELRIEKDKQDKILALKQAALQGAQLGADAAFSAKRNRLQAELEAELNNESLSESQKVAIRKRFAKQQQKIDIAQALINGALAIGNALATTKPLVPAGLIAAGIAGVQAGVQVAVIKSQSFDGGGGAGGGGGAAATAITSAPATSRILATPVGASALSPSQAPAAASAATLGSGLTSESLAGLLANLPRPVVTVEDINARVADVAKVEVRANI
jgi:hypothetical protein